MTASRTLRPSAPLAATPAAASPRGDVVGPWRPARLLGAPHRLSFFAAAVAMALVALWWTAALVARQFGAGLPWAVPPPVAHGTVMVFGFMPLFMAGFLFTAGPRWLGVAEPHARVLLPGVLLLGAGTAAAVVGFHAHALLAVFGVVGFALGWIDLLRRFARLVAASPAADRLHARAIVWAGAVGAAAMVALAAALALQAPDGARATLRLGLWGFLAPVFAIVSHRMLPFFTASALPFLAAWRPTWLLGAMLATLGVTGLAEAAEVLWWPLPRSVHATLALLQGLAGGLMLWLAVRWGLVHSLRVRLLAMLHGGFVWLGVALALAASSHARVVAWGESASLGLAPLHALAMGHLGATLLAMVTRVSAGHSGRPLAADAVALALYLALQGAAVARVGGALWPAASSGLVLSAAALWTLACAGWAWRYGGWLGRPRVDGRPG